MAANTSALTLDTTTEATTADAIATSPHPPATFRQHFRQHFRQPYSRHSSVRAGASQLTAEHGRSGNHPLPSRYDIGNIPATFRQDLKRLSVIITP